MSNAYIKTLKDGNGNIVYPQTKTGAIYRNDNSASLDSLLDAAVYMNAEEEGITPVTRDADTLGGYPASDYVKSVNGSLPDTNGNVEVSSEIFRVEFFKDVDDTLGWGVDNIYTETTKEELAAANNAGKVIIGKYANGYFTLVGCNSNGSISRWSMVNNNEYNYMYYAAATQIGTLYRHNFEWKPTVEIFTLLASGWSGNTYDLGNTDSDVEIELDSSATDEMIEAWTNAKILGSATSNILTAKGDVPTIDITCIMKRTVK